MSAPRTVLGACLLALLPAAAAPGAGAADALRELAVWLERSPRSRAGDDEERLERLEEMLDGVELVRLGAPERAHECDLALLAVAAHGWLPRVEREALEEALAGPAGAPAEVGPEALLERRISLAGLARLERRLDGARGDELARFLAAEVLARPREHAIEDRRAACDLLVGRRVEGTQAALFAQAGEDDALLREAAFLALSGWSDPAVHRVFADALARGRVAPGVATAHLAAARDELAPDVVETLADHAGRGLCSGDWRAAVRAVRVAGALPAERAAPLLIGALQLWTDRLERGEGSLRARHEVLSALQRMSGRTIGAHPDRWRLWWRAVQDGRVEIAAEGGGPAAVTSAGFFGLHPVTDRVTFVIDRSRSMRFGFDDQRSRWEAAVEELLRFAGELGPEGRFNVTVFHSGARSWRSRLVRATASEVQAARRWLEEQEPDGATALKLGVRTALSTGVAERIDPARVEADTVIVLCDGETTEGPAWVRPWLLRANAEAELVFHCVQLGGRGDGTLERLARESGGAFVHAR